MHNIDLGEGKLAILTKIYLKIYSRFQSSRIDSAMRAQVSLKKKMFNTLLYLMYYFNTILKRDTSKRHI